MVTRPRIPWPRRPWPPIHDSLVVGLGVWSVVLLAWMTYRALPLAEDPAIHFTGIHQAILRHDPFGRTWTFRGPVYNAYLATLYHAATLFTRFEDVIGFSVAVKNLHLAVLALAALLWGHGMSRIHPFLLRWRGCLVGVALVSLLTGPETHTLHAEDVAAALLFAASGLLASSTSPATLVGGVLCALLPLVKGATAVLCLPAVATLFLVRRRRAERILGFLAGFGVCAAAQALYFRSAGRTAIRDLFEAGVFQGATVAEWETSRAALEVHWPEFLARHPLLLPALAATCVVLPLLLVTRRFAWVALLLAHWSAAVVIPFAQGKYFTYHFAHSGPALATAIAALAFLDREKPRRAASLLAIFLAGLLGWCLLSGFAVPGLDAYERWKAPFLLTLGALLALSVTKLALRPPTFRGRRIRVHRAWLLVALGISLLSVDLRLPPRKARELTNLAVRDRARMKALEKDFPLARKKVLFLAYGTTARNSRSVSACRHFFPIPLQRFDPARRAEFEAARGFRENRDCVFGYRGRFILLEPRWMLRAAIRSDLRAFLRNYRRVREIRGKDLRRLILLERRPP